MDEGIQSENNIVRARQLAELEEIQLRAERLKLELASLKSQKPWYAVATQFTPIITAFVAFAGFGWGLIQYASEQDKNRRAQLEQATREQEAAEREFMKPWLEAQRETYQQALTAAATVANTDDPKVRQQAVADFWRLYQGKMILVETKSVSGGMVLFGSCLDGSESCNRAELNTRCRALATAMAASMAATARMTFQEFAANQFQYSSGPAQ